MNGTAMLRHLRRAATTALLGVLILPAHALAGPTYYVDGANGSDAYTATEATNPATPWKTIKKAVSVGGLIGVTTKGVPLDGYTVVIAPGLYVESVESKRDGLATAPVTITAATRGSVTIAPPSGSAGVFVSHHHHVIENLVVTGGSVGIKLGPHDGGDGPVSGLVARGNTVSGSASNGIQFANAQQGEAAFNTVGASGGSGINYSGNGGVIHDNTATGNAKFGIYVRDGVDHQVWNNVASGNPSGDIKVQGSQLPPPGGRTFFVGPAGDDAGGDVAAQSPATPWKTFARAMSGLVPGDTLLLLPGTYAMRLESVRDGAPDAPIAIRAADPGTATIRPASGSAVYIGHNHHVIEGLIVSGATTGLQLGPYKQTSAAVDGLVVRHNEVTGNTAGIKFINAITATAAHNVVWGNAKDGIAYTWANQTDCPAGSAATVFNNLVYGNGGALTGEYGITIGCGRASVVNNTVYANANGGIRIGVSGSVPVTGSVVNNIVAGSPVGIKEPAGSSYTGRVTLDFNDVHGNALAYGLGPSTRPGAGSIAVPPGFVDAASGDFRLGRVATGQAADSGCIDRGSDTADAVGLGGLTAFTDKYPDAGRVDLGYHGTLLYPSQGVVTLSQVSLRLAQEGASLSFAANLRPGAASDGLMLGRDFAQVVVGDLPFDLWTAGTRQNGPQWTFADASGRLTGTLRALADGSVDLAIEATGLSLSAIKFPTAVTVRIGDDYGSASALFVGRLDLP